MIGKSMFMAKKGGSIGRNVNGKSDKERIPPCTGHEYAGDDYDRITLDEQVDEYAGFPRIIIPSGR